MSATGAPQPGWTTLPKSGMRVLFHDHGVPSLLWTENDADTAAADAELKAVCGFGVSTSTISDAYDPRGRLRLVSHVGRGVAVQHAPLSRFIIRRLAFDALAVNPDGDGCDDKGNDRDG